MTQEETVQAAGGVDARPSEGGNRQEVPRGLVLFSRHASARARRRRWIFLGLFLLTALGLTWPVYSFFSAPRPLILGLPLSFAWVVGWLAFIFCAVLWLYRGEEEP